MVQEIFQGERLLGFLKISLKQDTGFSAVSADWQSLMRQLLWMLALSAIIALMARSSLLWLSYRLISQRQLQQVALDTSQHLNH